MSNNQLSNIISVVGISQYNAVNYFHQIYLEEFKRRKYNIYSIEDSIPAATNNKESFIFYFGRISPEIYQQLYKFLPLLPIVNIYVDHPYHYFPFNQIYASHFPIVMMPDWVDVLQNKQNHCLLGSAVQPHIGYTLKTISKTKLPHNRQIDVLFTGSFEDSEAIKKEFQDKYPAVFHIFENIFQFITGRENFEIDLLLKQGLKTDDENSNIEFSRLFYTYLDKYTRNLYRLKTLQALVNRNFKVYYYGNNAKLLATLLKSPKNFYFNESVSFEESLKLMQNSKIVLTSAYQNNMALLSERSLSAMANGAVSIHGQSPFLSSLFKENEEVISYSWLNDLEKLPYTIEQLLMDKDKLHFIADKGQQKAQTEFSVSTSVERLLEKIELFRKQYYSLILK